MKLTEPQKEVVERLQREGAQLIRTEAGHFIITHHWIPGTYLVASFCPHGRVISSLLRKGVLQKINEHEYELTEEVT